jgi:tetratricopeptide (TPR) repeat protein
MLFKMLGIENSWQQNRELRPNRPRQLFVTQSRMLADKVEEYFIKLFQSLVLASKTEGGISDLLERQKNREEAGLVDQDEAANWREDLPQKFSDLQDSHFPMFITFDKLSAMIEADMSHPPGIVTEDELVAGLQAESSEYMLQRRKSFISFDVFREEYWAHFPQSITKGLDVSLVFSEFMGVIKGSEMTLDSETHFLDYDTYVNLSARTQSTFASRRKEIYTLFESYLKMKRNRREYDAADRTHAILRSLAQDGMKGQRIDFLYVDEVQDNLLIDAKVLRAICCNPDGQFWAGDTAQTISVGSSFRFDDLKAFLHRIEERTKQQFVQTIASHQPASFQLVTNFRSHGGIVRCAHSVIMLITKFWPYAIDMLPEEKGIVNGIKPVFFSGWDQDNVRYESFLFGTAGRHIEFGAQQCILVRNDAAREKLRKQVGNIGLIMTLYESKGLEFNDVLLYNFFEDSTVDVAQWRVVLNAIDRAKREKTPAPTFDENRHAGVCSELKFLYVAITRARKNLWVVDRSETAEPMRIYWFSGDLVQYCTPGADVPQLAVSSSPEEWAAMARTLFSHKRYFQAMHSYERAGMLREKAIAYAYHLREQARGIPVRNRPGDSQRRNAYTEVAAAFLASAQQATILRERNEYYRIAAEAFLVLEDYVQAAKAFEKASKFTEAAQNYRRAGMFDETVSVIQNHSNDLDSSVASQLMDVARYYYLQRGNLKKASGLFASPDEELEFVRDCDLDIAEVNILEQGGRFREAADLHIRENRVLEAVDMLLRDKNSGDSTQLATQKLLEALWSILSFGITPDDLDGDAQAKLRKIGQLVGRLDKQALDANVQREFQLFEAIRKGDTVQLMGLGKSFHDGNKPAALLCLDHTFRSFSTQILKNYSDSQILAMSSALHAYALLVLEIISFRDPWNKLLLQKLFSFSIRSSGQICLPRGTFLRDSAQRHLRHPSSDDMAVEVRYFYDLYRTTLGERLRKLLAEYCDGCLHVHVFDPCEASAAGRCDRAECTRQHKLDRTWFDRRLGFHMRLVDLSILFKYLGGGHHYQRIWPERLYDVINPMHLTFGSSTNIDLHADRLTSRTFDLLKTHWIWPNLYDLHTLDPLNPRFLSTLLRSVDLGSFIDSRALVDHVNRTNLVQRSRPAIFMRRERDVYVILELLDFLRGAEYYSIDAGVAFMNYVIDRKIPIELTLLCRFLELVIGPFVMASTYNKTGSLHGVTLPRSWILENVRKLRKVQNKDAHSEFAWKTALLFQDLLENVYTGYAAGE